MNAEICQIFQVKEEILNINLEKLKDYKNIIIKCICNVYIMKQKYAH